METVIRRIPLSARAVTEITAQVAKGETILVVGPRYSGRGWLLSRLRRDLDERGRDAIPLIFNAEYPEGESQAMQRIREQLGVTWPGPEDLNGLWNWLEAKSAAAQKPLVLLLSNIDGLERECARELLRRIRAAINSPERWLTAVVTGESNVIGLVTGPESDLNCGYEYVLQGMDKNLFQLELGRWTKRLNVNFEDGVGAGDKIWALTGGNFSLVRRFLYAKVDEEINEGEDRTVNISSEEIENGFEQLLSMGPLGSVFFHRAGEIVARIPDQWPTLLRLLAGLPVEMHDLEPHILELSGVTVVRDGKMEFSSELMRRFVELHFGARKRGDLEALAGNFDRAFQLYQEAGSTVARPVNFQDEVVVAEVVQRLTSAFRQSELDKLESWLRHGVHLILGFRHFSNLKYDDAWLESPRESGVAFPPEYLAYLQNLPPVPGCVRALGDSHNTYGYVVTVGTDWRNFPAETAIAVWEPPEWHHINPPRAALLRKLLEAFSDAHIAGLRTKQDLWLERVEARLAATAAKIFAELFLSLRDPEDVLQLAASELIRVDALLQNNAFQRVTFIRANRSSETANAVFSLPATNSALSNKAVAEILGSSDVRVCSGDPYVRTETASISGAFYVLPVQTKLSDPGYLLLEVTVNSVPAGLEEPLKRFADQLNAALEQSERVALVSTALNRIADPVLLFDPAGSPVFANTPAATLLGLGQEGWRREAGDLELAPYGDLVKIVNSASEGRRVEPVTRIAGKPYRGIVVSDVLKYKSGKPAGILIHIPDQQYYAEMLRALQVLEDSHDEDSILARLVEVFQQQGHQGIRVYLLDGSGNKLIPHKCVDPRPDVMRNFPTVKLPPKEEAPYSWEAITSKALRVFAFSQSDHGEKFRTARGLEVMRIEEPPESNKLGKKPGDYWIDFPLLVGNDVTGKITIACDEHLSPERLEMMRVFTGVVGSALNHVRYRRSDAEQSLSRTRIEIRRHIADRLSGAAMIMKAIEMLHVGEDDTEQELRQLEKSLQAVFAEMFDAIAMGGDA